MKRLVLCIVIIAAIVAAGVWSCEEVLIKNRKLYGFIREVEADFSQGMPAEESISALENYFEEDYRPALAVFINDEKLYEMSEAVSRLRPMYESGCDEFSAECAALEARADSIYRGELPGVGRIF